MATSLVDGRSERVGQRDSLDSPRRNCGASRVRAPRRGTRAPELLVLAWQPQRSKPPVPSPSASIEAVRSICDVQGGDDARLIQAVRRGDIAAYGDLYSRHVGSARNLARQLSRT